MFVCEGTYAKWFWGKYGVITSCSNKIAADGKTHCAVEWIIPVEYFDSYTCASHFSQDKFKIVGATS